MRKLFNTLFVIIAAMVTFAGCAKEEVNAPANETKTVQFIAESIETKTAFGTPDGTTYPTLWTANDMEVHVSMNLTSSDAVAVAPSDDFQTARFETSVTDDGTGAYTFYSVSPASACISFSNSHKSYNVEIPTVQNPTANSVDEKAQIIVAKSEQFSVLPSSVNLTYSHLTAYGKMTLANLNLDEAVISSVALTASKNFAYRYYYYPESGTTEENGATKTITINTTSASDIWFACAPVDMSNSTMTVVVNTDKGTFTKTITFPADRKFEAGKIAKFSVDMKDISLVAPKVYELVANSADLTEGSQVVIVGESYAMSTNQKTNNRGAAGVTLSADKNTIATPGSDVQIFTIEAGKQAGTVAFNTGSGYIYAASSSSNHLKTQETLDDNASWMVTIADGGVASVVAQGTNTRNLMRFNPNNGSPMFSCYASTSPTGSLVSIYKLQGSGTVLENYLNVSPATISVDADATSASFTVLSDLDWTATSEDATVTKDGNTVTVTFDANTVEEVKTYTVTVTANGVDPKTVTITQKAWVDTSKIEELTVAEFIEKTVSSAVWYKLTGTVTDITSTTYGNFDLVDETGSVYIYGLTKTQVTSNDKSFASLGIKAGDVVTLITVRGEHNGNVQGGGQNTPAYYVSHMSACAAPAISCADNTVTITAEDGATIYYTTDGTDPSTASDKFDEAFPITETVTVKAIAVADGKVQSVVASNLCTYVDPNAEQPGEGQKVEYTILFGASYNSGKVSSYTSTWSVTNNGFKCNLANWNNNNNGWAYVKAGSKNNASIATITTANSISEALTTVKMTVDACTASKINSLKLYVSTSSDFTSAATYSASIATGDVAFNISSPVANAYYKIEVDCAKGSSNGLITVSKVVYSN